MLDNVATEFLERNGTSYEALKEKVDTRLYSLKDSDYIVFSYLISLDREPKKVSIGDIIGYDYSFANTIETNDIFKTFPNFFQLNGDSYHTRANGMLKYNCDNIVQSLLRSFTEEPIKIGGATRGKYVIDVNGLHRYTVLRSLYLIELSKLDSIEDIDKLKEKYTIPVEAAEIDYIKTYSYYVLSTLGVINYISKEYDDNYCATGNAKVEFRNKDRKVMSNTELLQLVTTSLMENKHQWIFFQNYLSNSAEFRTFMSTVCPEILMQNEQKTGGNVWKI